MRERDLELIRDYLDGHISPEGLEHLNALLATDDRARAEFRAMATLEEGLRDLSVASALPSQPETPLVFSGQGWRVKPGHLAFAALLVALLGLFYHLARQKDLEREWGDAVAKIEVLGDDARFASSHHLSREKGGLLGKGWVHLERGEIGILFRSGAIMDVEGPAAIGINSPLRAYLDFGKVEVYAPTVRDRLRRSHRVDGGGRSGDALYGGR